MLGRDDLAGLIPHQGTMCLLDRVIDWDDEHVVLATATHRALDNPLRADGRLRGLHLCEYGAQAMAVHGGLSVRHSRRAAQSAFLVSLRDVKLRVDFIEQLPGELQVAAHKLLADGRGWLYTFEVLHGGRVLAQGRAAAIELAR
jgi:predicted hotdog family 3-hydroxylacyl-ACP dehydratase